MMESRESMLIVLAASSLMLLIMSAKTVEGVGGIGINWGRQQSQKLLPSMVVDMCLANGIEKVKLFSLNDGVLRAFARSNIQIMVTVPNNELTERLPNANVAKQWVESNITYYINKGIDINYIGLGVEPFSRYEMTRDFQDKLPDLYDRVQKALGELEVGDKVKVTIPHGTDILTPFTKPSEADFRSNIKGVLMKMLKHHDDHDTPFMVNIFPHVECLERKLPIDFGYFDGNRTISIVDGSLKYDNMFDVMYDAFVWALRKNGFDKLKVSVGQTGWPTDGHSAASPAKAKRYFNGYLGKIAKSTGTPLLPGIQFESYLYALVDENERLYSRGAFERHYGIYSQDGQPKFEIDFTLQGRDVLPEPAVGISYMPKRWCVLDTDALSARKEINLLKLYNDTCIMADCTRLVNGSSCSHLSFYDKVSYAFNMYFQQRNQDIRGKACNLKGLGKVVDQRPEFGECIFPVNILSTLFINSKSTAEMEFTLGTAAQSFGGDRLRLHPTLITILPFLWLLFTILIFGMRPANVFNFLS